MTETYDLEPTNGRKSFWGKAKVTVLDNGMKILYSYGTSIMCILPNGNMYRFVNWCSPTTGNHIRSFSGLRKNQFLALPLCNFKW